MKNEVILIVDDDRTTTDALMMSLESEHRTVIACHDTAAAELIVERVPLSMVLSDVKFSGPFGFEGLDFIPFVSVHAPDTPIVLMTGTSSDPLRQEAAKRGALEVIEKPFDVERIEEILRSRGNGTREVGDETPATIRIPALHELIESPNLIARFQPIVDLRELTIRPIGFEALVRLKDPIPLIDPLLLFSYAEKRRSVPELEFACIARAMRYGSVLSRVGKLFMNLHPQVFTQKKRLIEAVTTNAERNRVPLDRLVFEITEQGGFTDHTKALDTIAELTSLGIRFAFDDVGVAYSHLALIDRIKPAFLKVSQDFGTGFESDPTKLKLVRNILSLAADFGCAVILEGVESAETAQFARNMGVPYAQGYFFARPHDAAKFSHER